MASSPTFTFSAALFHDTEDTPRAQGTVLFIPAKIAKAIPTRPDRTRRVNVAIEKLPIYQAKVAGNGRGGYFVPVNKQRREWLEEQHGHQAKLSVILTPDTSKYGLPVAPAFEVFLTEDALVRSFFDDLSGGVQRRILFGLSAPKRESTQLHRAVATAEYLIEVRGKVDLKELGKRWRLPKMELNE